MGVSNSHAKSENLQIEVVMNNDARLRKLFRDNPEYCIRGKGIVLVRGGPDTDLSILSSHIGIAKELEGVATLVVTPRYSDVFPENSEGRCDGKRGYIPVQ